MNINFTSAVTLLTTSILLAGSVLAQTPAAKPASPATAKAPASTAKTTGGAPLVLKTAKEKTSYAIGTDVGTNVVNSLRRNEIEFDEAILFRGLKDGLSGAKLLLTDDEIKAILMEAQKAVKTKQEAQAKAVAEKNKAAGEENKKEGEAFLAANKTKEGVVTLASGLQYKILKQGDGPKPLPTDTVECNYRGTLVNGTEFDSSYKRGQTASFGVTQVIHGWTEILQLMPVGSKYQVFIPSELGYGPRGAGTDIGPNATLIFEIELVSIKAKPADAAKPAEPAKPADAAKPAEHAK
jgi:FKBP-type peptidyl-prolyl cis-trans isomerase